jgi:hypothetical protein
MGVLDRVRTRARLMGSGTANAGRDIVKAPSRLIRSLRPTGGGDSSAAKPEPAAAPAEAPPGDGIIHRARANPWLTVAIAAGGLLMAGWIAWAAYVASERGATAGLGVVIAWPALLTGLVLVALPFVGLLLLIRRLQSDGGRSAGETAQADEADGEAEDEQAEDSEDDQGADEPEGSEAEEVPSS